MEKSIIILIRWGITILMLVISLLIWLGLPNNVPIHFSVNNPDSYGDKIIYSILFLLNLSTFIPWRNEKIEFHGNDITEEMIKEIQLYEDKRVEYFHLVYTVVMSLVTLTLLIAAKMNT